MSASSRAASASVAGLYEAGCACGAQGTTRRPGSQTPATENSRPGVVLLIVVILLALFAVVGLGFMLYAESEATAARIYREGQAITNKNLANIPAQELLNYAMGQLVYGCKDDGSDVLSAMRGHNLSLTMYGWNYRYIPGTTNFDPNANQNTVAFNGLGALRNNPTPFNGLSDFDLPNYQYFRNDVFIRDPERYGFRSNTSAPMGLYIGGANAPYTAADRNNMFLAQIVANDPSTNLPKVLAASFVRPHPRFGNGTLAPNNPAWFVPGDSSVKGTRPELKYMVLRPRPGDHYYNPQDPTRSFPPPEDPGGDVKNLPGVRGYNSQTGQIDTNDSYWIDLAYPVQVTPNGRKFKPLFAFLVMDLDHMLNLNVHGNLAGGQPGQESHASHQGLGAHEVNLSLLFTNPAEYRQLFQGSLASGTYVPGRFGDDRAPNPPNPALNVPATPGTPYTNNNRAPRMPTSFTPYLAKLDWDGVDNSGSRQPTTRFQYPTSNAAFPSFTGSYDNLSATLPQNPQLNNPFLYNPLRSFQLGDRKPFSYENLYYMYGTTGSLSSRSELAKIIPGALANARARFQMTTGGADLDSPGIIPWVDRGQTNVTYSLPNPTNAGTVAEPFPNYPQGNQPKPNYLLPQLTSLGGQAAGSEFLPNSANQGQFGAGRAAVFGRLDLNRKLAPFFDPNTGAFLPPGQPPQPTDQRPYSPFWEAMAQRQDFAKEIYERLVLVTGANPQANSKGAHAEHNALRYLAQLAVNIVDYIDEDDIATPFNNWSDGAEYVFGTELPKLVLNEAYAEMRNIPGEDSFQSGGAKRGYQFNFWLELLNPLPQSGQQDPNIGGLDRAAAVLHRTDSAGAKYAVHRIIVAQEKAGFSAADLRSPANTLGEPIGNLDVQIVVSDYTGSAGHGATATDMVLPNNNQPGNGNTTFFVIGPQQNPEPQGADFDPSLRLGQANKDAATNKPSNLSYDATTFGGGGKGGPPVPDVNLDPRTKHTILLQRLANPWLAPNPNQGDPLFNPYITIDYITDVKANDSVKFGPNASSPKDQRPEYNMVANKFSYGRSEPYLATNPTPAGGGAPPPAQFGTPQQGGGGGSPQNTFFNQNTGAVQPEWLVHLDRAPISVAEILHVSGVKPHELTQKFVTTETPSGQPRRFGHMAPWVPFDVPNSSGQPSGYTQAEVNAARIFRALDTFTVSDRTFRSFGGKTVGKLNINTIQDLDTFLAMTDPTGANNYFTQAEVQAVWDQLRQRVLSGRPGMVTNGPFWGAGPITDPNTDPAYPDVKGYGVQNTIYSGVFVPPQLSVNPTPQTPNPYAYFEMLTKIQNSLTTRSNAFAVFLTVGFFEVMDDTTLPVKLGAEIKNRNGQPTRHRMFAVVDRTNIALDARTSDPNSVSSLPDTQFNLRQAKGIRPAVLTSETSIVPTGTSTCRVMVAGGDPSLYDPDGAGEDLKGDTGMAPPNPAKFGQGSLLYIDVGPAQEVAKVMAGGTVAGNPLAYQLNLQFVDPVTLAPKQIQFPHAAGFMMTNVRLGNPGPQGRIDLSDPNGRYKYVVPYSFIIE